MAQFKIIKIKGCKTCNEVALIKQRDEEGNDYVQILAWHHQKDGDDLIQSDDIVLGESPVLIDCFLHDFSEASANSFASKFTV